MRCERAEKWISDALDGELSAGRQKRLMTHLKECAACRSYGKVQEKIQQESHDLGKAEVEEPDWEAFSAWVLGMLQRERGETASLRPAHPRWKWAWAGAVSLLVILFGLVFMLRRAASPESPVFSLEAFFNRFDLVTRTDPQLEELFAVAIAGSLPGETYLGGQEPGFFCSDDPFFWESLSDEELSFIEKEMARENKS